MEVFHRCRCSAQAGVRDPRILRPIIARNLVSCACSAAINAPKRAMLSEIGLASSRELSSGGDMENFHLCPE
jgi:hypothetical protein